MTWLLTRDSSRLDLVAPKPGDIHFPAIAEVLGKLPRFTGHTPGAHYSVAQHSLLVAEILARKARDLGLDSHLLQAYGLLHDAHEALLGDLTSPVKRLLAQRLPEFPVIWRGIVAPIDAAIFSAAGLPPEMPEAYARAVEQADRRALNAEFLSLFPHTRDRDAAITGLPAPNDAWRLVRPKPWPMAADAFLARLHDLTLMMGSAAIPEFDMSASRASGARTR